LILISKTAVYSRIFAVCLISNAIQLTRWWRPLFGRQNRSVSV